MKVRAIISRNSRYYQSRCRRIDPSLRHQTMQTFGKIGAIVETQTCGQVSRSRHYPLSGRRILFGRQAESIEV
jgi:hypothetical protein